MKSKVYIISGLGADSRVFNNLQLDFEHEFINWIKPLKNETIECYAARLLPQITTQNPILIGLSFGGIIAAEIAKQIKVQKVVFLSSVKTKYELPFYFKILGFLNLHKTVPVKWLRGVTFFNNWFFGAKNKETKALLKLIINDMDLVFLKWAIHNILKWKNTFVHPNTIHIHGVSDKILPYVFIISATPIKNGGHLMLLEQSDELSSILNYKL